MAGLPSHTYSVPQACDAHRTNLISAVAGVNTVAECKQLYRNFVINCSVLRDCPDCLSEDKLCFESCDKED